MDYLEHAVRAAFQERVEQIPRGAGDCLRQASYPVRGHRYPWKGTAVGALTAIAAVGAYLGVSSGKGMSAPHPLHTQTVAFIGSSRTVVGSGSAWMRSSGARGRQRGWVWLPPTRKRWQM